MLVNESITQCSHSNSLHDNYDVVSKRMKIVPKKEMNVLEAKFRNI